MNDQRPTEFEEFVKLLGDPQVREFLTVYLSICDPEARAHLRRVVADAVLSDPSRPARLKDIARRAGLRFGSTASKRGKYSA